jgi:RNA polymerase subunit RPABC4/transcription elongation factor Spt4
MAETGTERDCRCPFCDAVLPEVEGLCRQCKIVLVRCGRCGMTIREDEEVCPGCGLPQKEGE